MSATKVLFVPCNGREVAQFAPVQRELETLGCTVVAIALRDRVEVALQRSGMAYRRLGDYRTLSAVKVIASERPDLVLGSSAGAPPDADAFAIGAHHTGVPFLQVYDGIAADRGVVAGRTSFVRRFVLVLLRQLVHAATRRSNWRALLCHLVTLRAVNGRWRFLKVLPSEAFRLAYPAGRSHGHREGLNVAVPGHYARDAFLAMGFPSEAVFVVGQPRFDTIGTRRYDGEGLRRMLGIPLDRLVVVVATQPLVLAWSREDRKAFLEAIVRCMDHFPEARLVIKLHPEEAMEDYRRMMQEVGCEEAILCQHVDVHELLNVCSVLMTVDSTVALEAMLLGKAVICVDFTDRAFTSYYVESGAAWGVRRPDELAVAVIRALYEPQAVEATKDVRRRFLERHIYRPDGQASRRMAELIVNLSRQSSREGRPVADGAVEAGGEAAGMESRQAGRAVRCGSDRLDNQVGARQPAER